MSVGMVNTRNMMLITISITVVDATFTQRHQKLVTETPQYQLPYFRKSVLQTRIYIKLWMILLKLSSS